MASIFRPTVIRYVDKEGNRVTKSTPGAKRIREKSNTWRGRYIDAKGKERTVSLLTDKGLSQAKLAAIVQRVREEIAGVRRPDPYEVHREIPLLCPKCTGAGCKNDKDKAIPCEANHLTGFREHLEAKGNSKDYVSLIISRVRTVCSGCSFKVLDDLAAGRVAAWLKDQRAAGKGPQTSNHFVASLKTFGNWLYKDRRHPEHPFAHLTKVNAKVDVRCVRRVLSREELSRLVHAAEQGKPYRGLSGKDRAMLYVLASFTGLRVSELASLTEMSFVFSTTPPTVTIEAGYSKHRREDVLPLHPMLAAKLAEWLQERRARMDGRIAVKATGTKPNGSGKPCDDADRLFPGTWSERSSKMLRKDLEAARQFWLLELDELERDQYARTGFLQFKTSEGQADFHALRHTFITNLANSGVHPKLAKELARHSTITLTMDRYAHVGLADMNSALQMLPAMSELPTAVQSHTLTSDAPERVLVAPMVALETVQPGNTQEISLVLESPESSVSESEEPLIIRDLRASLRTLEKGPAAGVEPATPGLQNRWWLDSDKLWICRCG